MSKFSNDLSEDLKEKVKNIAATLKIDNMINIKAVRLTKTKKDIGVIVKGNDLTQLFTNDDSIVAIALYEDAFDELTDDAQNFFIENLLSQVSYDYDKDKIVITKPELNVPIGMYHKYGNEAIKNAELAILTIDQIHEREKEMKEVAKALKIANKKKNKGY